MSSGGIGLVQEGLVGIGLVSRDAGEEPGNSKGSDSTLLGVLLLDAGQVPTDVIDTGIVFHGETVGLCFDADLVDEDPSVGGKTGKGQDGALIDADNLANGAGVLEFGNGLLLDGKDDAVLSLDSNDGTSTTDGLHGVLDLQQMSIWTEDGNGTIVRHC